MVDYTIGMRKDSSIDSKSLELDKASSMASSSPLSSVPSDVDRMSATPEPEAPAAPEANSLTSSDATNSLSMDLDLDQDPLRRSTRKRKMPARYSVTSSESSQSSQSEEDSAPGIPAKRRRSDPKYMDPIADTPLIVAPSAIMRHDHASMEPNAQTQVSSGLPQISREQRDILVNHSTSAQLQQQGPGTPTKASAIKQQAPLVSYESEPRSLIVKLKIDKLTLEELGTHQTRESQSTTTVETEFAHHNRLASLSANLSRLQQIPISEKPQPIGVPEVWADHRVPLCESLPGLYEAYNSAFYGYGGVAKSFMIDGGCHPRDICDENVIILRAGGSMIQDEQTGNMVQGDNQDENAQTAAVRNAIAQQSPLAVICGDKNRLVLTQMPHKYNSLSWYKPTHIWFEMDEVRNKGGVTSLRIIKYRLEKLQPDTPSWWVPESYQPLVRLGELGPPLKVSCPSCDTTHEQIYLEGWMCLTPGCPDFWKLPDGNKPSTFSYDPRFLKQRTQWVNDMPPYPIRFPLYVPSPIVGEDYKRDSRRGMVCPDCGKCNSRIKWEGWHCDNCGFEHMPTITTIPAAHLKDRRRPVTNDGPSSSYDYPEPQVVVTSVNFSFNYRWMTYRFRISDDEWAEVVHGIANQTVREEPNGPDFMWEYLQTHSDGMVRRKLSNSMMNSFTMNYGMPYKFIAAGNTRPFTDAPKPITDARSRLIWSDKITSDTPVDPKDQFNELYLVGYLEGQKMDYHDDGEAGLGSTVATLSLGSPAEMYFRPKREHFYGFRDATRKVKNGKSTQKKLMKLDHDLLTMENPLPNFCKAQERKVATQELMKETISEEDFEDRLALLPEELGLLGQKKANPHKDWLRLWLAHGDIVIMRGSKFQKYFEHSVESRGLMRYALTCRTVQEGHLKPSELPDYEVEPDEIGYDGHNIV